MLQLLNPGIRSHGVTIEMKPLKECFMDGTIHLYIYIILGILLNICIGHGL